MSNNAKTAVAHIVGRLASCNYFAQTLEAIVPADLKML